MWDWELIQNSSGHDRHKVLSQYINEELRISHTISMGCRNNVYLVHSHSQFEIIFCISGDVCYIADGISYKMTPGSLLFINPAIPHRLYVYSDDAYERYTIFIPYSGGVSPLSQLAEQCLTCVGKDRIGSAFFEVSHITRLRYLLERMDQAMSDDDPVTRRTVIWFTLAFLADLRMIFKEMRPSLYSIATTRTADSLMLFLNQNFTKELTLDDVARQFHMSSDYCNRLFKQATGTTVLQYILFNRILYAKKLIAQGVPISVAATRAGFSDYSNFFRTYKKITGRTPREDRQAGGEV